MKCVLVTVDHDSVTGVVPSVELHHIVDLCTELVGGLAFAFVSPLGSDDYYGWHGIPTFNCRVSGCAACKRCRGRRAAVSRSPREVYRSFALFPLSHGPYGHVEGQLMVTGAHDVGYHVDNFRMRTSSPGPMI